MPQPLQQGQALLRFLAFALFILFLGTGAAAWYGYEQMNSLSRRVVVLEAQVATTTSELQQGLQESQSVINSALEQQAEQSSALQSQIGSVQQQFGTISSSVNTLQKLSQTDPQLLAKYSKVYFLNENYIPASLSVLPKNYTQNTDRDYSILTNVEPYLLSIMNAAKQSDVDLLIDSAYRSFAEQQALKGEYTVVYGKGTANSFSADQGYSEHQLGTTVDFITPAQKGTLDGFDKTSAYAWLSDNAYRFGFILSYPKGNDYYIYEPWHWRFVGVQLATYLHDNNKHFYDLDQRQINTYLADIFD